LLWILSHFRTIHSPRLHPFWRRDQSNGLSHWHEVLRPSDKKAPKQASSLETIIQRCGGKVDCHQDFVVADKILDEPPQFWKQIEDSRHYWTDLGQVHESAKLEPVEWLMCWGLDRPFDSSSDGFNYELRLPFILQKEAGADQCPRGSNWWKAVTNFNSNLKCDEVSHCWGASSTKKWLV